MIKKKREELGITQETLAQLAEVSVRTVQRAEKGENINMESLKSIAGVLNISWDLLIERNPQLKKVQEEFSKQAERLAESRFFRNKETLETMMDLGLESIGGRVVDLACGPGILTEGLVDKGWKVTALDITKEMLDIIRKKNLNKVKVIRGDVNRLPFEDGEFKGAFTRLSLHHFEDPQKSLEEMKRVIQDDGIIVIGDILAAGSEKDKKLHNAIEKLRDPSHTHCLFKDEIVDMGSECGLELMEYRELQYERELEEWTNISGSDVYDALYTILENLVLHGELSSLKLQIRDNRIFFTHTWGFFKFRKK